MSKLDKAEADIDKVNKEIEVLHDTIDDKEEILDTLKKESDEDIEKPQKEILQDAILKEHNDKSKTKPIESDKNNEKPADAKVNIKVTNFSPTTALEDTASEKRVIKHLERAIKDKLTKAGLDTGKYTLCTRRINTLSQICFY